VNFQALAHRPPFTSGNFRLNDFKDLQIDFRNLRKALKLASATINPAI
jgi:hypothetical protein